MLHFPAYFPSGPARAFTDAFAKATHTLAQFSSTFHRLAARYVLAKTFATASGALAAVLVRVTDASVFPPGDITASAASPVRHMHDAAVLIRVLLILHARVGPKRRASKCEWKGEQNCE
jgi:hypothetical protein